MPVIAHGVDLVHIPRIAGLLEQHGPRFLARVFTTDEANYALSSPNPPEKLAARFAAKEAAFKALHTGWPLDVAWTDASVLRLPSGAPTLQLQGNLARIALDKGIIRWCLSLSHAGEYAFASVLGSTD